MTDAVLEFKPDRARSLLKEVADRSGQILSACYQCRRCAAGCTVADETGHFTPDRLIRTVLMGDRETALNNDLVWKCVSCYTCGVRCPNDIQTARITETLKKMAKEAHEEPRVYKVAHFHDAFVDSGVRWGRVNEMEFMSFYELKNAIWEAKRKNFQAILEEFLTQAKFGFEMFKLKRMHAGFLAAKGRGEIKRLAKKARKKRSAA